MRPAAQRVAHSALQGACAGGKQSQPASGSKHCCAPSLKVARSSECTHREDDTPHAPPAPAAAHLQRELQLCGGPLSGAAAAIFRGLRGRAAARLLAQLRAHHDVMAQRPHQATHRHGSHLHKHSTAQHRHSTAQPWFGSCARGRERPHATPRRWQREQADRRPPPFTVVHDGCRGSACWGSGRQARRCP